MVTHPELPGVPSDILRRPQRASGSAGSHGTDSAVSFKKQPILAIPPFRYPLRLLKRNAVGYIAGGPKLVPTEKVLVYD